MVGDTSEFEFGAELRQGPRSPAARRSILGTYLPESKLSQLGNCTGQSLPQEKFGLTAHGLISLCDFGLSIESGMSKTNEGLWWDLYARSLGSQSKDKEMLTPLLFYTFLSTSPAVRPNINKQSTPQAPTCTRVMNL